MRKDTKKQKQEMLKAGDSSGGQSTAAEELIESEEGQPQRVEVSAGEFEELKKELEQARQQAAENFEGWQRERADFSNFKKRVERDYAQTSESITAEIIKEYLVIVDDLERALKARPVNGDGAGWAEGIELIYRKLQKILESKGVTPIAMDQFDPTFHEAISHEDCPGCESGEIIEVVQQGYQLGERVIRPALVRVAR